MFDCSDSVTNCRRSRQRNGLGRCLRVTANASSVGANRVERSRTRPPNQRSSNQIDVLGLNNARFLPCIALDTFRTRRRFSSAAEGPIWNDSGLSKSRASALFALVGTINMAQVPRFRRVPARHRGAAGGSKDTPPVGQINGYHSIGGCTRSRRTRGRRYVVGESDGHELRALHLHHAERYPSAEQQPSDDPMPANNAGDRRSRLPAFRPRASPRTPACRGCARPRSRQSVTACNSAALVFALHDASRGAILSGIL